MRLARLRRLTCAQTRRRGLAASPRSTRQDWLKREGKRIAADPATTITLPHGMILGFNSGGMFRTRFGDGPAQAIGALRRGFRGHGLHWVIYERDPAHQKHSAHSQSVKIRHLAAEFATWQRENCPPGVFDRLVANFRESFRDRLKVLGFHTQRRADRPFGGPLLPLRACEKLWGPSTPTPRDHRQSVSGV